MTEAIQKREHLSGSDRPSAVRLAVAAPAPRQVIVHISTLQVSADPAAVLVTYGLGACIAVTVHDPKLHLGGMIHFMLPFASSAADRARERPAMFADTGIPLLFERIAALGARREDLVIKVAGGGALQSEQAVLKLGQRNHTALRKILWKHRALITAEDVGGTKSRTVRLHVGTGRVTVTSLGVEQEL